MDFQGNINYTQKIRKMILGNLQFIFHDLMELLAFIALCVYDSFYDYFMNSKRAV